MLYNDCVHKNLCGTTLTLCAPSPPQLVGLWCPPSPPPLAQPTDRPPPSPWLHLDHCIGKGLPVVDMGTV